MAEGKIGLKELVEPPGITFASYPGYKKDKPLDRALIVSDGTHGQCLDHVGPAIDYWLNELGLGADEWEGYPAGVWIWEGTIKVSGGGYFEDREEELEGEHRALTEDEWSDFHLDGAGPWDSDDWIETYVGPPEDPDPVEPAADRLESVVAGDRVHAAVRLDAIERSGDPVDEAAAKLALAVLKAREV